MKQTYLPLKRTDLESVVSNWPRSGRAAASLRGKPCQGIATEDSLRREAHARQEAVYPRGERQENPACTPTVTQANVECSASDCHRGQEDRRAIRHRQQIPFTNSRALICHAV